MGEKLPNPGSIFLTFFSGENFGGNSAENFPPKMLGKNGIFRGKSEKSVFQEIPWNFTQQVIFRGKNVRKIGLMSSCPWASLGALACRLACWLRPWRR
jgi:hypothetical protein